MRTIVGVLVLALAGAGCADAVGPAVLDDVALIRQSEAGDAYPAALGQGTLVVEEGCLAMAGSTGAPSFVLWPPSFALQRGDQGIEVIDDSGNLVAGVGEPVQLGGGWMYLKPAQELTHGGVPARCQVPRERYFITSPDITWELDGVTLLRHRSEHLSAGRQVAEGLLGERNGCVALLDDEGNGPYLVWPRFYLLTGGPNTFQLVDVGDHVVATWKEHLRLAGGPAAIEDPRSLPGGIPGSCQEDGAAYWFVGEIDPD